MNSPPPAGDPARGDWHAHAAHDVLAALGSSHAGLDAERITVSEHCTRCGGNLFFSHRGGARERQMAVLGIREARSPA